MPSSIFEIIISIVIMASSTRRPSAMMSAPREMRCRLMSIASMADEDDGEDERDGQGDDEPGPDARG